MRVYQRLWLAVCAPVVMAGLSIGVVFVPIPVTVLAVSFGAGAALLTWMWPVQSTRAKDGPRTRGSVIVRHALVAGAGVGAFVGFTLALGAGVLLLLTLGLASSPRAVSAYGHWLLSLPTPSPTQMDKVLRVLSYASPEYLTFQPSLGVGTLTDEELCESWRASYAELQHPASAARLAVTVAERQGYLDELERRHPDGFEAWLVSGARAPGNPLPYLHRGRADQPTIDWDELTREQDW